MELKLTRSEEKDLPIIAKEYGIEMSKPPYNESWTEKKSMDKMKFFNQFYDLFTIRSDNQIVGFICINPMFMCPGEVAFGEEMVIKENFQNKGIGTWVFGQIFEIYRKKGFKKFMGISYIGERPLNLYKRLGILPSKKGVLIEKKLK